MVFHAPYPLRYTDATASAARPVRMLEAFRELGYRIFAVTGTAAERKRVIRDVKRHLAGGGAIDFVYSESSTMPSALTERHHLPLHPFVDTNFFRYMRRRGIPVGVFYRDIHWLFPEYARAAGRVVAAGTRVFYRMDLRGYRAWADRVYVPSMQMAARVPRLRQTQFGVLPPGCVVVDPPRHEHTDLTLFYVGAVSDFVYKLHACVQGSAQAAGARLIMCTPEGQWSAVEHEYAAMINDSIEIVSGRGAELEKFYARADLCTLLLEPVPYFAMAAPMKLYEYIGHGKPVIASEGTLSGEFVAEHGIGWTIPYSADALVALLERLRSNPAELERVRERVRCERHNHTWLARARQVADDLTVGTAGVRA